MSEFTLGPWQVRRFDGDEWPQKRISISAGNEAIVISPRYNGREQDMPNYHLIAAAPELYEALVEALEDLDDFATSYGGEHYNNPKFNAVLKKARGEAHE